MFLINGRVKENADTAELGRPLQIMISSVLYLYLSALSAV